ncbi:M36 family metallopeptidase [Mucilaginibacter psychrotolerans]|uniref:Peptidase M36 n=1 Tax=Mucilaginibacter psychrotolerans TaxID=1524096 RepID=A0A4Y8SFN7_9SPHI|nr:M36 family metallopeptidase [Mucilaginibacter psychrotolerans]TFF37264.1 peptidase M36 [Mucilaginibacter psychrotolerans]
MKTLKAKIEKQVINDVPHRIYDIEVEASEKAPKNIAEDMLRQIAPDLEISPDLSQLKFDQVKDTILGSHVLYQQQFQGKPISGAWIRVDIDPKGKVYNILNDLVPEPVLKKTERMRANKTVSQQTAEAQLTADDVRALALKAVEPSSATAEQILSTELVYFPKDGIPVLAWKVIIDVNNPKAEWKIYFDAVTGGIIDKINILAYANGVGKVFDPNPVVALNDTGLKETSVIPATAYNDIVLNDIGTSGMLDGPFVNTKATNDRVKSPALKFNFTRNDRAFKEVMVYFHIDRAQRYIQALGFNNVLNTSISVNIDGTTDDNSFYSPSSKSLTFGTGGVDDAEDAEVILHEYGHAIQDNQVPGFGASKEAKAMGEGFGDYMSASFFSDKKSAGLKPTIANWDAVAYSGDEPPCLRRMDSNKKYPRDIVGEEHSDGEIWSACLWEIRAAIGRAAADKLIIAHHFLLSPRSGFQDAANALITTDGNLNQGRNERVLHDIFIKRGILPNPGRGNKRAGARYND